MNHLTKLLTLVSLFCVCLAFGGGLENLLPGISDGDFNNIDNSKGLWYPIRNAECIAKFESRGADQTLRINRSGSGYANFRSNLHLAPGDYTFDVLICGNSGQKGVGIEVYSYPENGAPHPIATDFISPGKWNGRRMTTTFTVPEKSKWQRFALAVNCPATVEFREPRLYRGRHDAAALPPRDGAGNEAEILPPLPVRRYVNRVPAGDVFTIEFKNGHLVPAGELRELKFSFHDGGGRRVTLSSFTEPQLRLQDDILHVELPISQYALPGEYTWKLEGLGCEILPLDQKNTLTVLPPEYELPGKPGTKFPRFNGTNRMTTPAGEQSLFVYSTYTPGTQRYYNWRHTGGHMYEVFMQSGDQLPDGTVDLSNVERNMMQILAGDPDAGIYLKIRVDTPSWWAIRHPGETFVSRSTSRSMMQSYCSEIWMQDMKAVLRQTVDGIAARPVGRALAGVLIMGFRGGEFQLWGEDQGEYDCSLPARKAFEEWQRKEGFAEPVALPHPALEFPFKSGTGYAEIRERFFRFTAERHAQNLIEFARFFKETYGDKYSFGIYFGYAQEHGSSFKRMLFGGHLAFDKVLKEAPLDTIGCPASYGLRRSYRSHGFMNLPESASLRGILSIIENDFRTFVAPHKADSSGPTLRTMRDTYTESSRLALFAAAHGAAIRYLALSDNEDWFAPLPSIEHIRRDNLRSMKLTPAPVGSPEQIAWAIDTRSWCKAADAGFPENKWRDFCSYGRDAVMRTGRSVAFLLLDDVIANPGRWKYLAIPAPGLLPAEKLAALEAQYGKLPPLKSDTGALVIADGEITTAETIREMRDKLATPEALKAGWNVVWYVGGNFIGTWDGKKLDCRMKH